MKRYEVYQPTMSDDDIYNINMGLDEMLSEIQFRLMTMRKENAQDRVLAGQAYGCYKHRGSIGAYDLEHAFDVGNGVYHRGGSVTYHGSMQSVSVGNVLHDTDTNLFWACCSTGWEQVNFPKVA